MRWDSMDDHTHSYHPVDHDFRVEYNNEHGADRTYHNGQPHIHRYSHADRDDFGTTYFYPPAKEPDSTE